MQKGVYFSFAIKLYKILIIDLKTKLYKLPLYGIIKVEKIIVVCQIKLSKKPSELVLLRALPLSFNNI
jgi:hypothetical protein